jgi:PAS domain S-box-containing protein
MFPSPSKPNCWLPRGLAAYLALAFSLLSIVLTLVLVGVVERAATEHVKLSIGHGLSELALQTSDKLDRGMFERYREVALIAQRASLVDSSLGERRQLLTSARESYAYYGWLGLAGLDGKVLVSAGGLLEGADVSQRPWFNHALRGTHVGDVHEAVLLAKLLPQPQQGEPMRFVDVAFPYFGKDGKPLGVLGAHLSWQWARDVERSIIAPIAARRRVEALIVSAAGVVLLGPPELQGKQLAQPSFRQAQQSQGAGYLVEQWPDGKSYLVGVSRSKGYADYPGLGWTVLVRQDVDNAYLPVKRLRQQALGSGLVLALLFSLAGAIVAGRITRPLKQLAQSARRIQQGETLTITPGEGSYDEVKALAGSLNALVAVLLQRGGQLQDLNATLERRVEERTEELARALAAVQANEQRINTIIETAQDAFIGMDLQGRVTDWNSQAQRMFGWSRQEALGQPLAELVVPERLRLLMADEIRQFNETGQLSLLQQRVERLVVTRQGQEIPTEMTVGLAGTSDTSFFGIFLRDISLRKKVERMKNEFVGTVSHELRTPLTSMRASLSLLTAGAVGELEPDVKELVDIAHQHCERLVRLVNDMLDVEKLESGTVRLARVAQRLRPLAEDAVAAMQGHARQAGVTMDCEFVPGADQLTAEVDRDRMMQVLINLLSNAIKFSPRGSRVTLQLMEYEGRARLSVRDRGCGIPDEFRERIFQRFAQADTDDTRRQGGTGLGLSICRSITEEHDGEITYAGVDGGGTVFHVELPLAGTARPA